MCVNVVISYPNGLFLEMGLHQKKKVIFILFLQSDGEDFNYIVAFFLGTAACLYQVGSL